MAIGEVEALRQEVGRWEGVLSTYRHHLLRLSLALHPFDIDESKVQSSKHVQSRLQAEVSAIEAFVRAHELPARPKAINKVDKQ